MHIAAATCCFNVNVYMYVLNIQHTIRFLSYFKLLDTLLKMGNGGRGKGEYIYTSGMHTAAHSASLP